MKQPATSMGKLQLVINSVLGLGLLTLAFFQFKPQQKIVYVNTNKLLLEYQGMKEAQGVFKNKAAIWQANVDSLGNELQGKIQQFEKERSSLNPNEVKLNQELIRSKEQQYQQYREAIQKKAAEEDEKLKEQLLGRINAYLKEYGKTHSYALILGATNMGNIVYAEPVTDVTDDVLKGLNEAYVTK